MPLAINTAHASLNILLLKVIMTKKSWSYQGFKVTTLIKPGKLIVKLLSTVYDTGYEA